MLSPSLAGLFRLLLAFLSLFADRSETLDTLSTLDRSPRMLCLGKAGTKLMPYIVGYGLRNRREVWTAEKPTARDALALVDSLQRSDEEIKFIRAPGEGEIGIDMLRVLADEEGLS